MIKATRRNAIVISLCAIWLIIGASLLLFVPGWGQTTLNDEIGPSSLPSYSDDNTSLTVKPVKFPYDLPWPVAEVDSEEVTSDYGAQIEVRYFPYINPLNICYMEVLVFNGTINNTLGEWSFRLASGNPNGSMAMSPHIVVVLPHDARTEITFKINLLSTNWNETFPTSTLLNGMNFTYTVYYSFGEVNTDKAERVYCNLLVWLLLVAWLPMTVMIHCSPALDVTQVEDDTVIIKGVDDPKSWIDHMTNRVDGVDRNRHNLVIETQLLVAILGAIAGYAIEQKIGGMLFASVVLLAAPLMGIIIVLIIGPRKEKVESTISSDPKEVLNALRRDYARKHIFLRRAKNGIIAGSLSMVTAITYFTFRVEGTTQQLLLDILVTTLNFVLIMNLILAAQFVYRHFAEVDLVEK